jgi:hypothetical protein
LFAVVITPDAPLWCFWTAYVVWLAGLHERLAQEAEVGWRRWLAGGALLGLGILSKYTMGLAGVSAALSLLTVRPWRRWLWGFVCHGAVAFAVSLPILLYNIQEHFTPLAFQWEHLMQAEAPTIRYLPEYIGGQILVAGFGPFFLTPWLIWRFRKLSADPRLHACLFMFLAPFMFFLYKAARDHLEINWPIMCYVAFWPLAARWFEEMRERKLLHRLGYAGFSVPIAATVALTCHLIHPFPFVPPAQDILTRYGNMYGLAKQVRRTVSKIDPEKPIFAPTLQWTSYLRFQHLHAEQIPGVTRMSHFTQKPFPWAEQDSIFVLFEGVPSKEYFPGFEFGEMVSQFPLLTRGQALTTFYLMRYVREHH